MKRLLLSLCVVVALFITACNTPRGYQTIAATETVVLNVNSAYLNAVVKGQIPTNNVPKVEAAFNDAQMALRLAAIVASGNANAPVPPDAKLRADSFVTLVNSQKP
jgi:hypothetical protein